MTWQDLDQQLAEEARREHAKAGARGQRIQDLASFCVSELIIEGLLPSAHRQIAGEVLFPILADEIYPLVSVDIPPRRETP